MTDRAWRQIVDEPAAYRDEVAELERRLLATKDPIEKQRLLRELQELTAKETRG